MTDTEREQRVLQLLRSLDEWERSSKSTAGTTLKSTGESNARIATLETELVQLGAQYRRKAGVLTGSVQIVVQRAAWHPIPLKQGC